MNQLDNMSHNVRDEGVGGSNPLTPTSTFRKPHLRVPQAPPQAKGKLRTVAVPIPVERGESALWFWQYVATSGLDDCWPWTAAKADGYGRFKIDGRLYSAHRIAYTLVKGIIPPGVGYHGNIVMHSCDNPACCNPLHLKLGTNRDNVRDMVAKGRRDFRSHMKRKEG